MRDSILTNEDIGPITHSRTIGVGNTQSMVFQDDDLPPIFDPTAPKHDVSLTNSVTKTLNKSELKKEIRRAWFK